MPKLVGLGTQPDVSGSADFFDFADEDDFRGFEGASW